MEGGWNLLNFRSLDRDEAHFSGSYSVDHGGHHALETQDQTTKTESVLEAISRIMMVCVTSLLVVSGLLVAGFRAPVFSRTELLSRGGWVNQESFPDPETLGQSWNSHTQTKKKKLFNPGTQHPAPTAGPAPRPTTSHLIPSPF